MSVQEFRDHEISRLERSSWATNTALRQALKAAGLVVKIERVFGIPFISSLSTNPAAGTSVRRGSTVTLYVV